VVRGVGDEAKIFRKREQASREANATVVPEAGCGDGEEIAFEDDFAVHRSVRFIEEEKRTEANGDEEISKKLVAKLSTKVLELARRRRRRPRKSRPR